MPTSEAAAIIAYQKAHDITLKRYQLERAIYNLDFLEGLALIRSAYNCTLEDAKLIHKSVMLSRTGH